MKTISLVATLAGAAFVAPAVAVDFTGPYAPANWTTSNLGTLTGGSPTPGSAVFSPTQLVLTGGNALSPLPGGETPACSGGTYGFLGPCQVQTTLGLGGSYSFSWSYLTRDDTGPGGDFFGVLVNGVRTALSDPGGASVQNGTASFLANSSFGWFLNCTDCIGGSATATVTNFAAVIPEPSTYLLMLAGAIGVMGRLKQRRNHAVADA